VNDSPARARARATRDRDNLRTIALVLGVVAFVVLVGLLGWWLVRTDH
jgi:heme A synthase